MSAPDHTDEAEWALLALGGEPHPCARALRAFASFDPPLLPFDAEERTSLRGRVPDGALQLDLPDQLFDIATVEAITRACCDWRSIRSTAGVVAADFCVRHYRSALDAVHRCGLLTPEVDVRFVGTDRSASYEDGEVDLRWLRERWATRRWRAGEDVILEERPDGTRLSARWVCSGSCRLVHQAT